jgi:hypothetical protein
MLEQRVILEIVVLVATAGGFVGVVRHQVNGLATQLASFKASYYADKDNRAQEAKALAERLVALESTSRVQTAEVLRRLDTIDRHLEGLREILDSLRQPKA